MVSKEIRDILDAMRTAGVVASTVYQNPSRANVDLSQSAEPMAVYFCTTDGTFNVNTHVMRESARVQLAFIVRAADISVDGITNDGKLEGIRPLIADFFARLRNERTLSTGDVTYRVLYQYDDTNTTGYLLEFTATEKQGDCISIIPTPEP